MDVIQTSAIEVIGQVEYRALHPHELQTDRLLLRPFSAEDADGLARVLSDSEAAQFIGGQKSYEEARDSAIRMRDAFDRRGWGTLAVVLANIQTCIGYCGVRPLSCTPDVELAFALERAHWGKGYATEAAAAVLDAAFVCLRFESIVGTVYPENAASQRVLAKLGLKFERKVFGYWPRDEAWLFRIHRNDWKKRTRP
jgi:RimJ/RimL family protein N-acetyltransferase